MQYIDFLPDRFRVEKSERKHRYGHVGAVGIFVCAIATAAVFQRFQQKTIEREVAAIGPRFDVAESNHARLNELNQRVKARGHAALLVTYLRHPWPRDTVLAVVLAPLPVDMNLEELTISRRAFEESQPKDFRGPTRSRKQKSAKQTLFLSPRQSDLKQLRTQYGRYRTVVTMTGKVNRSESLHGFLHVLSAHSLVSRAELTSLERLSEKTPGAEQRFLSRFALQVTLHPGYGQPGSASGPEKTPVHRQLADARQP
jgi:hypothetical protein